MVEDREKKLAWVGKAHNITFEKKLAATWEV